VKIRWAQEALQDRTLIWEYLSERNPVAALELDKRFSDAVHRLAEHPFIGITGRIPGTREWVLHEHYRLIYEINEETKTLWIITLIHTARCWPPEAE